MDNQEITKASLLQSKAKIIADRNERFAVIEEEVTSLKEEVSLKLKLFSTKIKNELNASS